MYPLFESIKIAEGKIHLINLHQKRIERSCLEYYGKSPSFSLHDLDLDLSKYTNGTHKLRLSYNCNSFSFQTSLYQAKNISSFKIVHCNNIDYHLKYENRQIINELYAQRGDKDDIIIIKNGLVTDSSICNLVFRKDGKLFTPDSPLLKGVKREFLLQTGTIKEINIKEEDLGKFEGVFGINAMR